MYCWRMGWSTSLRWGSTPTIETFAIFNSTCVLTNIWSEQSVCTSLNKNTATNSNLLRFKNVSATCITYTTECTVVQMELVFKWSKHSVCTAPQMCVCIFNLNNLCECLCVNIVPLVLRSVIFWLEMGRCFTKLNFQSYWINMLWALQSCISGRLTHCKKN